MNQEKAKLRFEELDVARALGDIEPQETEELFGLQAKFGFESDEDWEHFIAAVDAEQVHDEPIFSDDFADKLVAQASKEARSNANHLRVLPDLQEDTLVRVGGEGAQNLWKHPLMGWLVASVAIALLVIKPWQKPEPMTSVEVSLPQLKNEILAMDGTVSANFSKAVDEDTLIGDVVWNSERQMGYMTFHDIPVNDAGTMQYQLWIVDPQRDARPVDGGVFDYTGKQQAIIPIDAVLPIGRPVAFVVTAEKPGGVVVSAQENVVAIASIASN